MQRRGHSDLFREVISQETLSEARMKVGPRHMSLSKVRPDQPHYKRQRGNDRLIYNTRLHQEPTYLIVYSFDFKLFILEVLGDNSSSRQHHQTSFHIFFSFSRGQGNIFRSRIFSSYTCHQHLYRLYCSTSNSHALSPCHEYRGELNLFR